MSEHVTFSAQNISGQTCCSPLHLPRPSMQLLLPPVYHLHFVTSQPLFIALSSSPPTTAHAYPPFGLPFHRSLPQQPWGPLAKSVVLASDGRLSLKERRGHLRTSTGRHPTKGKHRRSVVTQVSRSSDISERAAFKRKYEARPLVQV